MQMDDRDRFSEQANKAEFGRRSAASMSDFDAADYRPYLEGLELDEDQADELLRIVWDIMRISIELNVPSESWGQIAGIVFDEDKGGSE